MPTASDTGDSSATRACVARFRLAWAMGHRPQIEAFLPPFDETGIGPERRRELLAELVAVDMEQRWQLHGHDKSSTGLTRMFDAQGSAEFTGPPPDPTPLDAYLRRFPELRSVELPLELLSIAYQCQRSSHGRLSIDEFLSEYDLSAARRTALVQRLSRLGAATTSSGAAESRTQTFDFAASDRASPQRGMENLKLAFGPYKVIGLVGSGGYGAVFLGQDDRLDRLVAIKVSHAAASQGHETETQDRDRSFVDEARRIAKLNHPNIVQVLDVDRSDAYAWYLVMEYVDGPSFKDAIASARMTHEQFARVIAQVARAVHHAHIHNIFHRDLKPSNILLNSSHWPYVVDFGMAVHARDQRAEAGRVRGTPPYMSPEQVRGESHFLDGRTDVWSLGVTLYEALAGHRPFGGDDPECVFDEILNKDVRPLRQVNGDVSPELERICLRCLAKPVRDRYSSAADLAADLEQWLESAGKKVAAAPPAGVDGVPPPPSQPPQAAPVRVVPRGLRSFGEKDAEFFLDLLPGPYANDGLPVSIHRWRAAIETPESPAQAVCVLYGPSGSGKSSIVRAGILPRLSKEIRYAVVDAGGSDVEGSLLAALLAMHPDLPTGATLEEACTWLRRRLSSTGGKVLLVVDQFEHWLHGHRARDAESLAAALRRCDGVHLQCLITVRSDFWLGMARYMEQLNLRLSEEVNCGRIDFFPEKHARKVLQRFGEAYDCLPAAGEPLSTEQNQFLAGAVGQIAEDGWVVPVRLALLAEMMKSRAWLPETLRGLGGETGLGVQFLEQTFDSALASPAHKRYRLPVEAVLGELLPEEGVEIKGQCRTRDELLAASGLAGEEGTFRAVIDVLDRQLRLITPIEQESATADAAEEPASHAAGVVESPAYQLTHDYR